jgi:hypothetical protein
MHIVALSNKENILRVAFLRSNSNEHFRKELPLENVYETK